MLKDVSSFIKIAMVSDHTPRLRGRDGEGKRLEETQQCGITKSQFVTQRKMSTAVCIE
jgi:hypothetical protein